MLNFAKISGYRSGRTTISLRQLIWSADPPTLSNDAFISTSIGEMSAQLVPTFWRSRKTDLARSSLPKFMGLIFDISIIIRFFFRFTNRSSSVFVSLELERKIFIFKENWWEKLTNRKKFLHNCGRERTYFMWKKIKYKK